MEVEVKVAGILSRKATPPLRGRAVTLSLDPGSTVADVISALGIPRAMIGSVTVNKVRSPDDTTLKESDSVAVIPAISGG